MDKSQIPACSPTLLSSLTAAVVLTPFASDIKYLSLPSVFARWFIASSVAGCWFPGDYVVGHQHSNHILDKKMLEPEPEPEFGLYRNTTETCTMVVVSCSSLLQHFIAAQGSSPKLRQFPRRLLVGLQNPDACSVRPAKRCRMNASFRPELRSSVG